VLCVSKLRVVQVVAEDRRTSSREDLSTECMGRDGPFPAGLSARMLMIIA
jgi:hypothetical protein